MGPSRLRQIETLADYYTMELITTVKILIVLVKYLVVKVIVLRTQLQYT
jgi:hypothetical protein